MKFALISDPAFEAYQRRRGFHLALAQYFTSRPYTMMFRDLRRAHAFIMLDNGVAEGTPQEWYKILAINDLIEPDEIVLPDVMRDAEGTATASAKVASTIPLYKRAVVPQGKDWTEWRWCLDAMHNSFDFTTICVAKHLESLPGGRAQAVKFIRDSYGTRHNVHLLGFYANPLKEIANLAPVKEHIRSIDSAAPIAWAQQALLLKDNTTEHCSAAWGKFADYEVVIQNTQTIDEAMR